MRKQKTDLRECLQSLTEQHCARTLVLESLMETFGEASSHFDTTRQGRGPHHHIEATLERCNFPVCRRHKRNDLICIYHEALAFKSDLMLEQRSTLYSGCPSRRIPMVLVLSEISNFRSFGPKPETITLRHLLPRKIRVY